MAGQTHDIDALLAAGNWTSLPVPTPREAANAELNKAIEFRDAEQVRLLREQNLEGAVAGSAIAQRLREVGHDTWSSSRYLLTGTITGQGAACGCRRERHRGRWSHHEHVITVRATQAGEQKLQAALTAGPHNVAGAPSTGPTEAKDVDMAERPREEVSVASCEAEMMVFSDNFLIGVSEALTAVGYGCSFKNRPNGPFDNPDQNVDLLVGWLVNMGLRKLDEVNKVRTKAREHFDQYLQRVQRHSQDPNEMKRLVVMYGCTLEQEWQWLVVILNGLINDAQWQARLLSIKRPVQFAAGPLNLCTEVMKMTEDDVEQLEDGPD